MSIQKFTHAGLLNIDLMAGAPPYAPTPVRVSQRVEMPGAPAAACGVWECQPGTFERAVPAGEVMHILSGAARFTSVQGETIEAQAGDTLVFSPDTRGTWVVTEALRKFFTLV